MRITGTKKRVALALLTVSLSGAGFAQAAVAGPGVVPDGAFAPEAVALAVDGAVDAALAAASASGCPASLSCGFRCTADLVTGFCMLSISWRGSGSLGGVQIGPSLKVQCTICECWYTYTNELGNSIFKRTTNLGCSGGFDGLQIHVM